jgi:hypothetical protein
MVTSSVLDEERSVNESPRRRHSRPLRMPEAISTQHRSQKKWLKLSACDSTICRKLEAYATKKSDTYFSNDAQSLRPGSSAGLGSSGIQV